MINIYILWNIVVGLIIGFLVTTRIIKKPEKQERLLQFKSSIETIEYVNDRLKVWVVKDNEGN